MTIQIIGPVTGAAAVALGAERAAQPRQDRFRGRQIGRNRLEWIEMDEPGEIASALVENGAGALGTAKPGGRSAVEDALADSGYQPGRDRRASVGVSVDHGLLLRAQ